ncbi:MAG: hypothetical protein ABR975_15250 [Vulcanimicrobiaceae bacterium]|jgi:hypothetical protein
MARFHQGTAPTHPHTTVDHREGGLDVAVGASSGWIALAQFHTKPERQAAVLASVETLMEQFGHERPVAEAFVMASRDGHRVIAFLWLGGHDAFRALQSAWDQHHRHLAREHKEEALKIALCHCTATSGEALFAVGGKDVVTFAELPANATLPTGDGDTILGRALLVDDVGEHAYLLTRATQSENDERRYHLIRSWGDA